MPEEIGNKIISALTWIQIDMSLIMLAMLAVLFTNVRNKK